MTMALANCRWCLSAAALWLLVWSLSLAQEPPTSDAPPANGRETQPKLRTAPTAEAIGQWIVELDSDVFDNRENATIKLVDAGRPAVDPVKKALQDSVSLEVTTRALHILRELGLSQELDTQDAARTALEELAKDPTSVGRRAVSAIVWLNEQRSAQTIAALEKLGAIINRTQLDLDLGTVEEIDGIQIDDSWQGTNRDFRRLKWLQNVDKLILVGDKIDDAILPYVSAMPGLKRLHLYRTKITERGLTAIGSLDTLQEIGIYYSPIGEGIMPTLKSLKELSYVRLYGTKISLSKDDLVASLKLDARQVDYRRGAFLGVSCQQLAPKCELATVHPESPAEKAGLKAGDTLVTFAGQPVTDYDSLTAVISQYGVGDVVEVEYLRRMTDENGHDSVEQSLKSKVRLGEWDVDLVQRQPVRP